MLSRLVARAEPRRAHNAADERVVPATLQITRIFLQHGGLQSFVTLNLEQPGASRPTIGQTEVGVVRQQLNTNNSNHAMTVPERPARE